MACIIILLTIYTMLKTTATGCKSNLMEDNKSCFDGYKTYLANLGNSGADTSQIVLLLCNEEGLAATRCLKPLLDECKELKEDPMYQMFQVLEAMGGCESSQPPDGETVGDFNECAEAKQCLTTGKIEGRNDQCVQNASTQFNRFLEGSKLICRELKAEIDCLKQHEDECAINEILEERHKQRGLNISFPPLAPIDDFVENQCPTFPEDFYTIACVRGNLTTTSYFNCYNNATNYVSATELTCNHYKSAYVCVEIALETCGDKYTSAFTNTTNFYLKTLFSGECQIEEPEGEKPVEEQDKTGKKTSGALVEMLSLFMMVICIFSIILV